MRILYLHRTQAKGVEGVHIGEVIKAMRAEGHDVQIVSPVGGQIGAASDKKAQAGSKARLFAAITRHMPELGFELLELAYNLQAIRQIRGACRRDSVDAIFERYSIFGLAGVFMAGRWRRRFYLEVNYTSCSPLVRRRSALLRPLARWVDRRLFQSAAALFPVSTVLKEQLIRDYGVAPDRIHVLPNAADPAVFDPARIAPHTSAAMSGRLIGFVGGFYPWHGLPLLLDAFMRIAPQLPDARLLLIGDGPMRGEIERRIKAHGLEGRVVLAGSIAHAALPPYIASFHIGVMPDSNDYGSPMKIFEYMAMGKPVVVPDYGPLRDAVTDGEEGLIFAPGNAADLARCLMALLGDPALHRKMSARARDRILTRHNWRENTRTILRVMQTGVHS